MSRVIAVLGKGGVGKTTVSALILKALADSGRLRVLAIDADPSGGLGLAFLGLGLQGVENIHAGTKDR